VHAELGLITLDCNPLQSNLIAILIANVDVIATALAACCSAVLFFFMPTVFLVF